MSWAKLDDQAHGHRKILRAWKCRAALGLHFMAISYAAGHEPKGFIPEEWVEEKLPNQRERDRTITALTDTPTGFAAGLWEPRDGGWIIHDWDDYNTDPRTREEVRVAKSEAGKKGAAARWGSAAGSAETDDGSNMADAWQTANSNMAGCHDSRNATAMAPFPFPLERGSAGAPEPEYLAPTDPLDGVDDPRLTETVQILRQCSRLQFDVELLGVSHALRAHPDADHVQAAHVAVSNAADPNYRTVDAGKALRYAIADLQRQRPARQRSDPPAKTDKPWKGALRPLVDQQRQRQQDNPNNSEAA